MMLRRWKFLYSALVICGLSMALGFATAQADDSPWQPPSNISNSGAATLPVIATAADGTLHALWWDAKLGTLYARTTSATETNWTAPVRLPAVVGRRIVDAQTGEETITAPRNMRLVADAAGNVYAFWNDSDDQLLSMVNRGNAWGDPVIIAEKAAQYEAASGSGDQLHLAYVRSIDTATAPAGIYYRLASGGSWGPARLVDSSAYYRALRPEEAHVSVAGNDNGSVLVTWDRPPLNESLFARSADQGAAWSQPQAVIDADAGKARRARVAFGPNSEFILLWQDPAASGCGLTQRRSSDSGNTWSAPEVVLSALARCDAPYSFNKDESGRVWLIGRPTNTSSNVVTVAAWDGNTWSEPRDVTFSFFDDRTQLSTNLNCVTVSITGASASIIGCDARNDIWATRNAVSLDQWLPNLEAVWTRPQILTAPSGVVPAQALPDIAADSTGAVYAVWNQIISAGADSELFTAAWRDGRWSSSTRVTTNEGVGATSSPVRLAGQPAIATDSHERVHLVWSGGGAGEIYYTWAYARDVGSAQRWNEATLLSPSGELAYWPDITADPRTTTLYAIYTLPYNEKRGVYLSVSQDSGQTWQAPVQIFDAVAAGWESIDRARLALDADRQVLHAVWQRAVLPGQVQATEIYYASSTDGGKIWSAPLKVAAGDVAWPQVIVPSAGQVYLAWCQTDDGKSNIQGQFSPDSGQRWSPPTRISQFDQVNCPISLATDEQSHMFLAGISANAGGEAILLASPWNGQAWNSPDVYSLRQKANIDNAVAIALVPQSNRLSALIKLQSQQVQSQSHFEIASTDRQIPAVGVVQPVPTFTPMPTPTAGPAATLVPTDTPKPQPNDRALRPPTTGGGPPPLVLGGVLAAIIVVVVVARIIWVKRR